jgi:hypothetical protein
MNRYTQLSTSQFDPLSLQELMMVPAMKRQKHDALDAQIVQSQLQADPLDVHTTRALEIKNDFEKKKLQYAERLAKEGVNPNISTDLIKFNKEYQDLISPMGEIGQINAAKKAYYDNYKDWMSTEEAKKAGPQIAHQRWMEHYKNYENDYNQNKQITNINQMSAPRFEDFDNDVKEFMTSLGETQRGYITKNGYGFDVLDNGEIIMIGETGKRVETNNAKQIEQATKRLAEKWIRENAPGKQWADFTSMDQEYIINQINLAAGSKIKDKVDDSLSVSRSRFDRATDKNKETVNIGETIETGVYDIDNNKNLLDLLQGNKTFNLGDAGSFGSLGGGVFMPKKGAKSKISTKEKQIKEARESQTYITVFNGLKRTNPEEFKDIKFGTPESDKMVQNYLTSVQNVKRVSEIVTPDVEIQSGKYPGQTSTNVVNQRTNTIKTRLSSSAAKVYDSETGEEITEDIKKSEFFNTIKYNGYVKAGSKINMQTNVGGQKVNPDVISYTDKNGETKTAYVTKDRKYLESSEFKATSKAAKIAEIASSTPGLKIKFKDDELAEMGLKDSYIQFDGNQYLLDAKIGNAQLKEPIKFETQEDLENFIFNAYQKKEELKQ